MIRIINEDNVLRVSSSSYEKVNIIKAKHLLKKAGRMINQGDTSSIIIELDHRTRVDKSALNLIERCIENIKFPLVIISA